MYYFLAPMAPDFFWKRWAQINNLFADSIGHQRGQGFFCFT